MAQPQPRSGGGGNDQLQAHQAAGNNAPGQMPEPIKYGDAFPVTGELAGQPIAPRDAAAMRSAEDDVPGIPVPQESGGGFSAAGFMESAATYNQAVGAVHAGQASDAAASQGVNVTQAAVPGGRIVTEFVAAQVVGQYAVAEESAEQDGVRAKAAGSEQGGAGHDDGVGAAGTTTTAERRN